MKKLICIILFLAAAESKAQQSITLKIKYLPNRQYTGTMQMNMDVKANLAGDEKLMDKLKSQGITQPLSLNVAMSMDGNTQTGTPNEKGIFPLKMNYKLGGLNAKLNGNAIPMPANTGNGDIKIYGHVGADGKLKADSVNAGKMKDTSERNVLKMMNSFQTMVKFPDKPLRIGETFEQDMPLNLPIAGNNVAAASKVVYKLVSVTDGKAYFDLVQSTDVTIPIKGSILKLKGNGGGKMVFDLKNSFPTNYNSKMDLKIDGKVDALQIDADAMLNMEYKTAVN